MNFLLNPFYYLVVLILVPIYWLIVPERYQIQFVGLASTAFLFYLHPLFALSIVSFSYIAVTAGNLFIEKRLSTRSLMVLSILTAVCILFCGKYLPDILKPLFKSDDWVISYLLVPMGISYFFMRIISVSFGVIRGYVTDLSYINVLAYLTFVPIYPAGPLETYWGFYQKRTTTFSLPDTTRSLRRISIGLMKKLLIIDLVYPYFFGDFIAPFFNDTVALDTLPPFAPILFCIVMFLKAYIDISAYTDLAIGVSGLFGFSILEDLHYPLIKPNLAEFWRSWHISVMNWCRDNIYFPVFASTKKVWLGLYASLGVMGVWHNADLNWMVWGFYQATGLLILHHWNIFKKKHKKFKSAWHSKALSPLGYIITFLFATFSFAIMSPYSINRAYEVAKAFLQAPFICLNII